MMPASSISAAPLPIKSCFARYVEDVRTADVIARQDERSAAWKQAAGVVTLIAFTAICGGALLFTGLTAPVYVPIILITAGCLLEPAIQGYFYFNAQASALLESAKRIRDISDQHQSFEAEPSHITTLRVNALKTNAFSLANLSQQNVNDYKPLLAIYNYWQNAQGEFEARATSYIEQARKEDAANATAISANYKSAKEEQKKALIAKTNAAFYRAVIQNPSFVGEFSSLVSFKDFNWSTQALYRDFQDHRADHVIEFTNSSKPAITMAELQGETVAALAQRFLEAMPAPAA